MAAQGCPVTHQGTKSLVAIATLLALMLVAVSAVPASAGVTRFKVTEKYAMKLVNCLRTGGRVTSTGTCKGFGSGKHSKWRAPLKFSNKISNQVSWPWAKRTVIANRCGHSLAGSTVDSRFRQAGLTAGGNGENIGCGTAWSPRLLVKTVLRWWQNEKAYNGWHWRQIKDRDFKSAGVGIAKLGNGRTRLVVNFYSKSTR
jgi:hypothetical protein